MIHEEPRRTDKEKIHRIERATVEMVDSFTVARFQLTFDVNNSQYTFILTTEQRTPGESADRGTIQQANFSIEGHFYKRVCLPKHSEPLEEKDLGEEEQTMQIRQLQQKELLLITSLEEVLRDTIKNTGQSWNELLRDRNRVRDLIDLVIHTMQNQMI